MHVSFKLKTFLQHTFIYGFSSVLARILNFLLTPLYVRHFDTGDYGTIILLFSWASIINAIIAFGMETSFFRFIFDKYNKKLVYTNSFSIIFILASLFISFTNIFPNYITETISPGSSYNREYLLYVRLFSIILFLDAITIIPLAYLRANGRATKYSIVKALNIFVYIFFNIFFIVIIPQYIKSGFAYSTLITQYYKTNWVGYVFLSNLLASALSIFLLLSEFKTIVIRYLSVDIIVKMVKYSWPIMVANLSFIINENIDKIMLSKLLPSSISEREIGIYGACSKIAIFLNIAIQAFRLGAEPIFFKHAKEQDANKLYANIMLYFVICISLAALSINVNIPILKYFIKGKGAIDEQLYWSGLNVIPILIFAYVFLGIYMNLSVWYKLCNKTYYGLYISGIGAVITIVFNFILIPKYGYMGSAITTLIAYLVMALSSYILGQKHNYIPYNIKKIVFYISLSAILSIGFLCIQNLNILVKDIILLLIILIIVLFEYNNIKKAT